MDSVCNDTVYLDDDAMLQRRPSCAPVVLDESIHYEAMPILKPPDIVYKFSQHPATRKFVCAKPLENWTLICVESSQLIFRDIERTTRFFPNLIGECFARGMKFSYPVEIVNCRLENIKEHFRSAKENGVKFIICLSDYETPDLHNVLKKWEHQMNIVTQHITYEAVCRTDNEMPSVVAKINLKLGGTNYHVKYNNHIVGNKDLYIGINLRFYTIPAEVIDNAEGVDEDEVFGGGNDGNKDKFDEIAILGYSANCGADPASFVGNYIYFPRPVFTNPQDGSMRGSPELQLDAVQKLVHECMNGFRKYQTRDPERVHVFFSREKCTGPYNFLPREYQTVSEKFRDADVKTVLCGYTVHTESGTAFSENDVDPLPGTVIDITADADRKLVFSMINHSANHYGQHPKITHYTMSYQSKVMTHDRDRGVSGNVGIMETIRNLYHLSFFHQLVDWPTHLPTPIYVAMELSKRGAMMLSESLTPKSLNTRVISMDLVIAELNDKLRYNSEIASCRFTA